MKGIAGKILVVDLSAGTTKDEVLDDEIYRKYIGGYGIGAWYIYKNIKPGCDPLGPDNILGFTPGLLTGSGAGFTGRYTVCGKSPLTGKGKRSNGAYCNGGWGNANAGGFFGPSIKKSGYDSIFFHGASEKPVYLLIQKGQVTLEDAAELWGKDTVETEKLLKAKHGNLMHVACIGQAGENVDLISGIVNDRGRIAARSGLGAVMGSKKLKALCIDGSGKIEYADPATLAQITKGYFLRIQGYKQNKLLQWVSPKLDYFAPIMRVLRMGLMTAAPPFMLPRVMGAAYGGAALGTPMSNVISAQTADSPIKNYAGSAPKDFSWKESMKLRGQKFKEAWGEKQYGCFSCPVRCGYTLKYDKLPYEDKETHRPEYETMAAFGSLIQASDPDLVLQANEYLNRAGMDTIAAGVTVSYVMEGVERGVFKKEDFKCAEFPDGFLPQFKDPTYVMPLLRLMVTREGIGAKLGDGVFMAKENFPDTSEFAICVNGGEMGMHDIRGGKGWAMSYMADPTPGRHTAGSVDMGQVSMGYYYPALKPYLKDSNDPYMLGKYSVPAIKIHQIMESLGQCMFIYYLGDAHVPELIKAATGMDLGVEELMEIGGRIQTTRQMFNAREGAIRHEMPKRAYGDPPQKHGPARGNSAEAETMVQGYYAGMEYSQNGVPTADTLKEYGLDEMIPDLAICTGAPAPLINEYREENPVGHHPKHKPAMGG